MPEQPRSERRTQNRVISMFQNELTATLATGANVKAIALSKHCCFATTSWPVVTLQPISPLHCKSWKRLPTLQE